MFWIYEEYKGEITLCAQEYEEDWVRVKRRNRFEKKLYRIRIVIFNISFGIRLILYKHQISSVQLVVCLLFCSIACSP